MDETPPWYVEPSLGRRVGARVLDSLLFLPFFALAIVLDPLPFFVLMAVVTGAYEITFVARDGQTLGKRWLNLRVVELSTGEVPSLNQAALRWAMPEVASLAPNGLSAILALVIFVPVLRRPLHRGLHDHVAGTVVTASRR